MTLGYTCTCIRKGFLVSGLETKLLNGAELNMVWCNTRISEPHWYVRAPDLQSRSPRFKLHSDQLDLFHGSPEATLCK